MKEHPILFSTPMVQAILAGTKTMTRRIIKADIDERATRIELTSGWKKQGGWAAKLDIDHNPPIVEITNVFKCPYGKAGDILWVRETFNKFNVEWSGNLINVYKADYKNREWEEWTNDEEGEDKFTWKPSIFMPKAACRIKLEITNIKVERLNDISEEDAVKEGIEHCENGIYKNYLNDATALMGGNPKYSFETLWQKINDLESWYANPFVWVIEFKKITT